MSKRKIIRRCVSCSHSHYEPYGFGDRAHLVCSIHSHPGRGISCIVSEGMHACPSYVEQFDLDAWRTPARVHAWQPPTYADTLDS